jgi:uncharacterized protein (TIGR00299 family) protein
MILGALFDLGLDEDYFKKEIQKLGFSGYNIEVKKVEKNHITAKDVYISIDEKHQPYRSYTHIKNMIQNSKLSNYVKKTSLDIFLRLAKAEGKIHNKNVEDVHFHEIGAVDSIIDIVGAVIGVEKMGIKQIYCSPLPLGKGFVKCAHGMIPIPAPATIELLKDVPVYQTDRTQEMVTPTGAAIITSISKKFCDMPPMYIKKIGYGSGKTKSIYPSLLRVYLGELKQ